MAVWPNEGGQGTDQATDDTKLTAQQHEAIVALLACQPFWEMHTNALDLFGLPTKRAELATLAEKLS